LFLSKLLQLKRSIILYFHRKRQLYSELAIFHSDTLTLITSNRVKDTQAPEIREVCLF